MNMTKSHQAVFAGLMGSAAWGVPDLAFAISLEEAVTAVSESLVLQFAVGCAAGALIAGAIAFITDHIHMDDDMDDEVEEDSWSASSLNLANRQEEAIDDDPTGDLGRFRTGQITIDFPVLDAEALAPKASGPRHFATASTVSKGAAAPARRTGKHFSGSSQVEQLAVKLLLANEPEAPAGKHFARAAEKKIVTKAPVAAAPVKAEAPKVPVVAEPAANAPAPQGRARLAALPVIESRAEVVSAAPALKDLPVITAPAVAEQPKKPAAREQLGITGRLRMAVAARTKNVREVLSERLGEGALDGVPQITRADGSHVEVTPTWFDQTIVPALANITGVSNRIEDTAPKMGQAPLQATGASVAIASESDSRSSYISKHVAEVNLGMFPERRSVDELEGGDVWEEALAAMGETIGQSAPVFQDVVGGPSTIDDPDGLEGPTGFIPFRVPAAHPEVVDTESYIDYLLRDEMSGNSSQALRRSTRSYLRVIEGGTNPMRIRRLASETGSVRTSGRHFAHQRYAQEA